MDQPSAIKLLRTLILHDSRTLDTGRIDAGWCCGDHAFVAALAFALKLLGSGYSRIFCYTAEKPLQLTQKATERISDTPFGMSIGERFGGQGGLWNKAAWFVAEVLKGNGGPSNLWAGRDADSIWEAIRSSPNRDDVVSAALSDLLPKE